MTKRKPCARWTTTTVENNLSDRFFKVGQRVRTVRADWVIVAPNG